MMEASEAVADQNRAVMSALKWGGGILAAVVGSLLVVVLMGTASTVLSHSDRLTRIEALDEARDASLVRIEASLGRLEVKVSELRP